jgi:hypothetical protein
MASSVESVAILSDTSSCVDDECNTARPRSGSQSTTERLTVDLLSIGTTFEDEAVALAYPSEIDVRG